MVADEISAEVYSYSVKSPISMHSLDSRQGLCISERAGVSNSRCAEYIPANVLPLDNSPMSTVSAICHFISILNKPINLIWQSTLTFNIHLSSLDISCVTGGHISS